MRGWLVQAVASHVSDKGAWVMAEQFLTDVQILNINQLTCSIMTMQQQGSKRFSKVINHDLRLTASTTH